ncbi:MAG TPA: hypothetical protein PKZ53_01925, partial [Acidobacteriota bacterium]|nr:hypothetical protein [Acidobacteriota bacterium]
DGARLAGGQRGFARATTGCGQPQWVSRTARTPLGRGPGGEEEPSNLFPVVAPKASQPTG